MSFCSSRARSKFAWLNLKFASASFADAIIRHAPSNTELVAFSTAAPGQSDRTTEDLKPCFVKWLDVAGLRGDALDACIRAERVDVLLELSGHSGGGRLAACIKRNEAALSPRCAQAVKDVDTGIAR